MFKSDRRLHRAWRDFGELFVGVLGQGEVKRVRGGTIRVYWNHKDLLSSLLVDRYSGGGATRIFINHFSLHPPVAVLRRLGIWNKYSEASYKELIRSEVSVADEELRVLAPWLAEKAKLKIAGEEHTTPCPIPLNDRFCGYVWSVKGLADYEKYRAEYERARLSKFPFNRMTNKEGPTQ